MNSSWSPQPVLAPSVPIMNNPFMFDPPQSLLPHDFAVRCQDHVRTNVFHSMPQQQLPKLQEPVRIEYPSLPIAPMPPRQYAESLPLYLAPGQQQQFALPNIPLQSQMIPQIQQPVQSVQQIQQGQQGQLQQVGPVGQVFQQVQLQQGQQGQLPQVGQGQVFQQGQLPQVGQGQVFQQVQPMIQVSPQGYFINQASGQPTMQVSVPTPTTNTTNTTAVTYQTPPSFSPQVMQTTIYEEEEEEETEEEPEEDEPQTNFQASQPLINSYQFQQPGSQIQQVQQVQPIQPVQNPFLQSNQQVPVQRYSPSYVNNNSTMATPSRLSPNSSSGMSAETAQALQDLAEELQGVQSAKSAQQTGHSQNVAPRQSSNRQVARQDPAAQAHILDQVIHTVTNPVSSSANGSGVTNHADGNNVNINQPIQVQISQPDPREQKVFEVPVFRTLADIKPYKLKELKAFCRAQGLLDSGNKSELADRLIKAALNKK